MSKLKSKRKFDVGDIVTIAKDYKDSANLVFAQSLFQVYSVMVVNTDGTIKLAGVWPDIPIKFIEGVPIESELAKQVYYDTNFVRPYEPGKVFVQECIYSRPPFMATMEERFLNTPMWGEMLAEEFHYVHELQHWLKKHIGSSKLCINQFWDMRKPLTV